MKNSPHSHRRRRVDDHLCLLSLLALPSMKNRLMTWLRGAPIKDALDSRNAPVIQGLLLFSAFSLPVNWAWHWARLPVSDAWTRVMVADMVIAVLAFAAFAMVRRGRFRGAIVLYLTALLGGLLVGYLSLGFQAHMVDQTSQMLALILSGLALGRTALWRSFIAIMLIFGAGFIVDVRSSHVDGGAVKDSLHFIPSTVFAYSVIVLVIDRCVTALRESLVESEEGRRRLQIEMQARERVQAELLHAQKLELAGKVVSKAAHDFNNVLAAVIGLAEVRHLIDDPGNSLTDSSKEMYNALMHIERASRTGVELAGRLLRFSRKENMNPEIFDAREVIDWLRPLLKQVLGGAVIYEFVSVDQDCCVYLDRSQFELSLLNVASNARDAMPGGGVFTLEVTVDERVGAVGIIMTDTGLGMSDDVAAQALEPFFTTKPAGSGTGLGLTAVHSLIISAGGELKVRTVHGHGTSIEISFPRARKEDLNIY